MPPPLQLLEAGGLQAVRALHQLDPSTLIRGGAPGTEGLDLPLPPVHEGPVVRAHARGQKMGSRGAPVIRWWEDPGRCVWGKGGGGLKQRASQHT